MSCDRRLPLVLCSAIVRRNLVLDTIGTSASDSVWAIDVLGPGNRVVDNDVVRVQARNAFAGGIRVSDLPGNIVVDNRVSDAEFGIVVDGPVEYRDNLTTLVGSAYPGTGTDIGNNH